MPSYQPFNTLKCIIQRKSHHHERRKGQALQMQTDDYRQRKDLSSLANVVKLFLNDMSVRSLDPSLALSMKGGGGGLSSEDR